MLAAGGFLVQLLPGAPENLITALEDNIFMMDQLTTILHEDGAEEVMNQVLKGLEPHILSTEEVHYHCPCTRQRLSASLRSIGAEALKELAAEGTPAEVVCQFCGKAYRFPPEELTALAEETDTELL